MALQAIPAIHAYWTAPREPGPAVATEQIITMIFSALTWRHFHGPIALFADSATVDYLSDRQVLDIYDSVRQAEIDQIDAARFPPDLYFSLPKLVALQASMAPVTVLDLDLFLRRPLPSLATNGFVFAHYELPNGPSYPAWSELPNPNKIDLPNWDPQLPACNMSIAAFGNQRHLDDFTGLALRYLADNTEDAPIFPHARIVFAEQRLSAYTARRNGMTLTPMTTSVWDPSRHRWTDGEPDAAFHHTWHRKFLYAGRQPVRDRYCRLLVAELLERFPEAEHWLAGDPETERYMNEVRTQPLAPPQRSQWRRLLGDRAR